MTRLKLTTTALVSLFVSMMVAQDDMNVRAPEMTQDPEQQQQWIDGQNPYSAKPRNMWDLNLHGGHSFIGGDVAAPFWSGIGAGLSVRKAISYTLSLRLGGQYNSSKGYDGRATSFEAFSLEPTYRQHNDPNPPSQGPLAGYNGSEIFKNYETTIISGNLELLVNIGNILFHRPDVKWSAYIGAGVGYHDIETNVDLLNGTSLYNFESISAGLDPDDKDARKDAQDALKDLLDDDYETAGATDADDIDFHGVASVGISRRLGGRVSIGLEHQVMFWGSDLMDGYLGTGGSSDLNHYTSLQISFSLGNKEKRTAPLYWVNPMDATMNDIAELKQRPKFDLTDSDGDGVIDMIDQEINTPAGCPVDTRGVTLDSDGDGIADCKDKEPYSPPGFDVDSEGVAQVPTYVTEQEVRTMIGNIPKPEMSWFLPMVHFDLDKYYVKPEFYGSLHSVSQVMKNHPNLKLVVKGYSDNRGTVEYNNVLSYNRADAVVNYLTERYTLPRDRFIVQYAGEDEYLVPDLPDNYSTTVEQEKSQYMNRRVEFRIAGSGDSEMARPEGEAGSATPGSAREGAKYSGNRNSGY